jgi:general secretion pathway protein A
MGDDIFSILKLDANPFSSSACTKGYFHTSNTKRILEELHHGIRSRKGFLVLVGEVGVGKTSLLYQFLHSLEGEKLATAWVFNTLLDRKELLLAIARDYALEVDETTNLARLIETLHRFFLDRYAKGYNCAIIVDEAHNLSPETLEALRMLSNLEQEGEKLVQILLVGQPELKEKLDQPNLRQLRSRIGIFLTMNPLDREETSRYVHYKLNSVGAEIPVLPAAIKKLWKATEGNSRMTNLIMERALYGLVAYSAESVDARIMDEAVRDVAAYQIEVAARLGLGKRGRQALWLGAAASVLLLLGYGMVTILPSYTLSNVMSESQPQGIVRSSVQQPEPVPPAPAPSITGPNLTETPITETPDASGTAKPNTPPTPTPALTPAPTPALTPAPTPAPTPKETVTQPHPEAHVTFLKQFDLEHLLPVLDQTLRTRNIGLLEHQLPPNIQLVQLQELPTKGNVRFSALSWPTSSEVPDAPDVERPESRSELRDGPQWIALWEPVVRIDQFYPGHKSKDITELQWMLRNMGYYAGTVDGVVGPLTWQAINQFQREWPVTRTGNPSMETVFWIAALYEKP